MDAPPQPIRPGRADLAILAYVTGLLLLWTPLVNLAPLSPRMAVLFVGLGPGLVVLVGLAKRGDVGARWGAAYLVWAALSVAVSHHPRAALMGSYGSDIGLVYLMGYFSAWALGRRLRPAGRRVLPGLILVGLGVNALFAVIEAVVEPTGDLATEFGRVHGLMSNSLFLAGALVGGVALVSYLAGSSTTRRLAYTAGVVPLVLAVNLTGSRAALVGGAVLAVAAAFVSARRADRAADAESIGDVPAETADDVVGDDAVGDAVVPPPLPRPAGRLSPIQCAGLVGVAVVVGFLLSIPLQSDESGASRLSETSSSSGYTSRGIMWPIGLEALADRPLTGWGPGRFREATAPRVTRRFVEAEGPDKLFYDAHNLVVEQAVTTGVVGLVLLLGFGWAVVRRCRGPLAWFAGGVALTWLVNPVSVCTGPIAMLALGAAWQVRSDEPALAKPGSPVLARSIGAVLMVIGLLAGTSLLWADHLLDDAVRTGDLAKAEQAERLLPGDPVISSIVAQARGQAMGTRPTAAQKAGVLAATRRSVELDPAREHWWVLNGYAEQLYGQGDKAERLDRSATYFREALERSPWSVEAMLGLKGVAIAQHDKAAEAHWDHRLCQVGVCSP